MSRTILTAIALAAVLAACGGSDEPPSSGGTPTGQRLSSTAKITIVEPAAGAMVRGTETVIKMTLDGGKVIEETTTELKPDEGHVHVKLDGKLVTLLGSLEHKLTGLTPGSHLVEVEFVAADHGPFNPRVLATVTFSAA